MRILRIFKLVRHFAGLQSLIFTLQQAYQASKMLLAHLQIEDFKTQYLPNYPWFNFQAVTRTVLFI